MLLAQHQEQGSEVSEEVLARHAHFREAVQRLEHAIGAVMVGQKEVISQVLAAMMSGGHVLLEGVPGLGKTLLVRSLAEALRLEFSRIQFTPDLMPADILGTTIITEDEQGRRQFEFRRGPVFTQILLADEINRATPKTQAALLEAMQEGSVTIGGETHQLSQPFLVLATQNPLEMEGTYPLPEAQIDRFLYKIQVPFPTLSELSQIIDRTTGQHTQSVEPAMTGEELLELRDIVRAVPIAEPIKLYGLRLILATHPNHNDSPDQIKRYVQIGSSPRGAQALILGAKVHALMSGRGQVDYEDIKAVALPALRHRILLNFEGQAEGLTPEALIENLLKEVSAVDPKLVQEAAR